MARLPPPVDPTLQAADAALEAVGRRSKPRPYLGMSGIGHPCARKLWYGFRWSAWPEFDATTLKRFEDGHRGEDMQAERLRLVPEVELLTVDPETGQQYAAVDHGGHFRGHCDGFIRGLLQAPKTRHVWEHKQVGEKKQAELEKLKAEKCEKAALAAWDETYHAQAVLYMAYFDAERHYLTCASPGGRRTVSVRTEADPALAELLRQKALTVIQAAEPPARLSEKPEFYICKWCEFQEICHGDKLPAVTCRSCCHATPELDGDGRWSCARWKSDPPLEFQAEGCDDHVYIPALVSYATVVDADSGANRVRFKTEDGRVFTTGTAPSEFDQAAPVHYTSRELHAVPLAMICDQFVQEVREQFGATIEKGWRSYVQRSPETAPAELPEGEDFDDPIPF